jgi:hypothetical protein
VKIARKKLLQILKEEIRKVLEEQGPRTGSARQFANSFDDWEKLVGQWEDNFNLSHNWEDGVDKWFDNVDQHIKKQPSVKEPKKAPVQKIRKNTIFKKMAKGLAKAASKVISTPPIKIAAGLYYAFNMGDLGNEARKVFNQAKAQGADDSVAYLETWAWLMSDGPKHLLPGYTEYQYWKRFKQSLGTPQGAIAPEVDSSTREALPFPHSEL